MTPCAVKGCDQPAQWLVTQGDLTRAACDPHADQAKAAGYQVRPLADRELQAALAGLRSSAEQRRRIEHTYWRQFRDARTLGASYRQLGDAAGLNPPNARHHVKRLQTTKGET